MESDPAKNRKDQDGPAAASEMELEHVQEITISPEKDNG